MENSLPPQGLASPEHQAGIFIAVGQMTMRWALMEFAMDSVSTIIYHDMGGRSVEEELPRMTDRKIQFLRRCFQRIEALADFRAEALLLLDQARAIVQMRHDITHGYMSGYDPATHVISFIRLKLSDDNTRYLVNRVPVPVMSIINNGIAIESIGQAFSNIAERLMKLFVSKYGDDDSVRQI